MPIGFANTYKPAFTTTTLGALGNRTIYIAAYFSDVANATVQYLMTFGGTVYINVPYIVQSSNTLRFGLGSFDLFSTREGEWSIPITEGYHTIGMNFNFGASTSADPVFFVDGVKQTVTETEAPDSVSDLDDGLIFGGQAYYAAAESPWWFEFSPWRSRIDEVSFFNVKHPDATMAILTKSRVKGLAKQFANLTHYFPLNEVSNGVAVNQSQTLLPTGDVNSLWSTKTQATYWASVDENNGTDYIRAANADDNEEQQLSFGTYTVPAGVTVYGVVLKIQCKTAIDNTDLVLKIKKGASWITIGNTNMTTTSTLYEFGKFSSWTQAEIDGIEVGLLTPTMAKNDEITVYYVAIELCLASKVWKDEISGVSIFSRSALGRPEAYLTSAGDTNG